MEIKLFFVPSGLGATVLQDYLFDHPSNLILLDFDRLTPRGMDFEKVTESDITHIIGKISESEAFINQSREWAVSPVIDNIHVVKTYGDRSEIQSVADVLIKEGLDVSIPEYTPGDSVTAIHNLLTNGTVNYEDALDYRKKTMGDNDADIQERIDAGHVETSSPSSVVLTEEELELQNEMIKSLPKDE